MKTFEEFLKDIKTNVEMMTKFKAALTGVETAEAKTETIVKLARENGYDVSVEDFSGLDAENRKLDDEELKLTANGLFNPGECWGNNLCWMIYHDCEWEFLRIRI